jgi:hypothetical protein
VLFYNVRLTPFATAMRSGVRFERSFQLAVNKAAPEAAHYHRYEPAEAVEPFKWWQRAQPLRTWAARAFPRPVDSATASWYVFSEPGTTTGRGSPGAVPQEFGVELLITAPPHGVRVHTLMKFALDGLIAACHHHSGSDLELVAGRVATTLGIPGDEATDLLTAASTPVLGPRRLLWPHRTNVQWNPADDRCVAVSIRVRHDAEVTAPLVAAALFEVEPRATHAARPS